MRFAYADPPYIGYSRKHYGDRQRAYSGKRFDSHPDFAGEIDHEWLIEGLVRDYPDGWALSCNARSLRYLLNLCPQRARVLVWAKTNAKYSERLMWAWEPVILCRDSPRSPAAPVVRDWVSCARVERNRNNTKGSKPKDFCYWLFDAFGIQPDDTLDDLFPGSGAVTDHLESWRTQLRIPDRSKIAKTRPGGTHPSLLAAQGGEEQ